MSPLGYFQGNERREGWLEARSALEVLFAAVCAIQGSLEIRALIWRSERIS